MKKLLSILGVIGLSTTATFNLVACDNNQPEKETPNSKLALTKENWDNFIANYQWELNGNSIFNGKNQKNKLELNWSWMLATLGQEFKTVISDHFDLTTASSKIFFYTKSTIDQESISLITDHPQTADWNKLYLDLNTITDKAESGLGINFNEVYNLDGFFGIYDQETYHQHADLELKKITFKVKLTGMAEGPHQLTNQIARLTPYIYQLNHGNLSKGDIEQILKYQNGVANQMVFDIFNNQLTNNFKINNITINNSTWNISEVKLQSLQVDFINKVNKYLITLKYQVRVEVAPKNNVWATDSQIGYLVLDK
ncbi:lipoprotein [Spiroplasma sp. DGKH1]|uniref:lipoprotein n=1 Tax=Spiroplasma sp. DGKH1 TaxID=3050074 RepID=UPI0034C6D282